MFEYSRARSFRISSGVCSYFFIHLHLFNILIQFMLLEPFYLFLLFFRHKEENFRAFASFRFFRFITLGTGKKNFGDFCTLILFLFLFKKNLLLGKITPNPQNNSSFLSLFLFNHAEKKMLYTQAGFIYNRAVQYLWKVCVHA